jgi:hypothetical protein
VSVAQVEVLVEEPSAEAAMELLLPRILGSVPFQIHQHRGKSDLLAKLPRKLKGYASWIPADWRILVVVDRDADDCRALKLQLEREAAHAGLRTRTAAGGSPPGCVVNRIAIEELEAGFFGDWAAVRVAYPRVDASVPRQARYRAPDLIRGGTWEALERILGEAGYYGSGLPKIEVARNVARHMDPAVNTSPSFRSLRAALQELAA